MPYFTNPYLCVGLLLGVVTRLCSPNLCVWLRFVPGCTAENENSRDQLCDELFTTYFLYLVFLPFLFICDKCIAFFLFANIKTVYIFIKLPHRVHISTIYTI